MPLRIQTRKEDAADVIALRGHLILEHGNALHEEVRKLLEAGSRNIVVDLAGVDFIDSHGLGQMVACQTTAKRLEGQVRYTGLSAKMQKVLTMTGMMQVLQHDPDLATALGKMTGS